MNTNNIRTCIISLYSEGRRLNNFLKLVDNLVNKNMQLTLVLQNYPQNIISDLKGKNVEILITSVKNPAHVRNVFLQKYYSSNYDYFIFLDDDVILDAKLKTKYQNPLQYLIREIKISENNIAIICLEENTYVYRYIKKSYKVKRLDFWASCFVFKNIFKLNNIKLYFDENLDALEEIDFAINLYKLGYYTEWHRGFCAFQQMLQHSTYGNNIKRKEIFKTNRLKIYKKHSDVVRLSKDNKLLGLILKNG